MILSARQEVAAPVYSPVAVAQYGRVVRCADPVTVSSPDRLEGTAHESLYGMFDVGSRHFTVQSRSGSRGDAYRSAAFDNVDVGGGDQPRPASGRTIIPEEIRHVDAHLSAWRIMGVGSERLPPHLLVQVVVVEYLIEGYLAWASQYGGLLRTYVAVI